MQSNITDTIFLCYFLKIAITGLILALIISKLKKWEIITSIFVAITSIFASRYFISTLLSPIFLKSEYYSDPCIYALLQDNLLKPLILLAMIYTFSYLYLSKEKEFAFNIKNYLLLVLFQCSITIIQCLTFSLFPEMSKYLMF